MTNVNEKGSERKINTQIGEKLLDVIERLNEPLKNNHGHLQSVDTVGDHKGIQFMLDNCLRALHFQLYGTNGNFGNLKEQVDRSQENVMRIYNKHSGDIDEATADPSFEKSAFFLEFNNELFNVIHEVYAGFEEVYEFLTGEPWVFVERGGSEADERSPEDKKAILKALMRRQAQEGADENAGPPAVYRDGEKVA